mgnify:CR=1 FL=1
MKFLKIITLSFVILIANGCNAQSGTENRVLSMLKEFYIAYSKVSFRIEDAQKVDSLQEKYCTEELRKEAKEWYGDGHDLLTNDWGIEEKDIKTIEIKKDVSKSDTYIVTYTTFLDNPGNIPPKKDVRLQVTVVKENDGYKINKVW